jgi:hypothetical protein
MYIILTFLVYILLPAYFGRRLHDVTITIGLKTNQTELCAIYRGPDPPEVQIELFCGHVIEGRYVRISKPNNLYNQDCLSLCEVGIYED